MTEGKFAHCFDVRLVIDHSNVTEVAKRLLVAIAVEPWPGVTSWLSPLETDERTAPLAPVLEARALPDPDYVQWDLGEQIGFYVELDDGDLVARWRIYDTKEENAWRWLAANEELIVRLLRAGVAIRQGIVAREGHGVACLPWLPVVGEGTTYIAVATEAKLAWGFEDGPSVIAEGGWETKNVGDYLVMSRAMHAETNVELLEAVWAGHWAMARLANPDLADYSRVRPPTEEEAPIVNQGSATLDPVGYDAARNAVLYSSVLGAGEHVRGWEILALRTAIAAKKLSDGRPVDRIEVIFPDEEMARAEMRPLRDVGVHVGYYGDSGERIYLP